MEEELNFTKLELNNRPTHKQVKLQLERIKEMEKIIKDIHANPSKDESHYVSIHKNAQENNNKLASKSNSTSNLTKLVNNQC